jgi:hypothetical protein
MVFLPLFVLLSFARGNPVLEEHTPAEGNELVFDMTDKANNVELGSEVDGMRVIAQIVPGVMAATLVNLVPCGVGLAHSHAHVDAIAYVIDSNPLFELGYVNAEGTAVVLTDVKNGMTIQAPRGMLHWVVNKSCKQDVKLIQFFNGDNVGQDRPDLEAASIPRDVLAVSSLPPFPPLPPRPRSGPRLPTCWRPQPPATRTTSWCWTPSANSAARRMRRTTAAASTSLTWPRVSLLSPFLPSRLYARHIFKAIQP